jgi:hypothetical protein
MSDVWEEAPAYAAALARHLEEAQRRVFLRHPELFYRLALLEIDEDRERLIDEVRD